MTARVPLLDEQTAHEDFGPIEELRRRLIAYESLSLPLKVLTWVTLGVLFLSGVVLASSHAMATQVITDVSVDGRLIQTPLIVYLTTVASMLLGWCCVFVASLRIHLAPRLGICVVAGIILGYGPVLRLDRIIGQTSGSAILHTGALLPAVQTVVLLALISLMVAISVIDVSSATHWGMYASSRVCAVVLVCLYFGIDALIVIVYDPASSARTFIPSSMSVQSTLLPSLFAIVVYWGSTDFIEWGETLASSFATVLSRKAPLWLFFATVVLISSIFVADTVRRLSLFALLPSLLTSTVVVLLAIGLIRLARLRADWPAEVPMTALLAGAMFLFLFVQVTLTVVSWLATATHIPSAAVNPVYTVVSVSLALIFFCAGLFHIRQGRKSERPYTAANGLFIALVALLVISLSTPQLANVLGLPVVRELQPNVADLKILAGMAVISIVVWLATRHKLTPQVVTPFTAAIMLIIGLQVIGWYFQLLLPGLYSLSKSSTILAAILFIGAITWDVVTSGSQVTNRDSVAFPRAARLLLYFGYALFACATFLYATSQHFALTGQAVPLSAGSTSLEVVGAEGLGLPLLGFTFAQRITQWNINRSVKGNTDAASYERHKQSIGEIG